MCDSSPPNPSTTPGLTARHERDFMLNELLRDTSRRIELAAINMQQSYKESCEQSPLAAMLMLPMIVELRAMAAKMDEIIAAVESGPESEIVTLCQAVAHPGCEPGKHELASKILKVLGVRGEAK